METKQYKYFIKGTHPLNIVFLKSGHIGHINFTNIDDSNKFFKKIVRNLNLSYFLVLETMSLLYVRSKVCMAPFDVRSKVCMASIHVRSKVCKFASHMVGSNAHFAPHMERSHADFAPHMEGRHSFRYQIIAKPECFANVQRESFKTTNILGVYTTYATT